MRLIEVVFQEQEEMEAKFEPLEEQFAILDKCEVTYTTEVSFRRENLVVDWEAFKETVITCEEVSFLHSFSRCFLEGNH